MPELKVDLVVDDKGSLVLTGFGNNVDKVMWSSRAAVSNFTSQLTIAGAALTALAGSAVYAVSKLTGIADEYTLIEGRLKLVTTSTEELVRVEQALYEITLDTHQNYESTATLYTGLARSTKDLGVSEERLLGITTTLNQAMLVSGASAEASKNSMTQMTQAMFGGTVRAEEFNSIMENTPRILEAVADGLGVSMGELRAEMLAGELSAERFLTGLEKGAAGVAEEYAKLSITTAQALGDLKTVFYSIIDDANDTSDSTGRIAESIIELSETIEENREEIVGLFTSILDTSAEAVEGIGGLSKKLGEFSGEVKSVYEALPAWVWGVGIVAALIGGAKGKLALGAFAAFAAFVDKWQDFHSAEAWREIRDFQESMYESGPIELVSTDAAELRIMEQWAGDLEKMTGTAKDAAKAIDELHESMELSGNWDQVQTSLADVEKGMAANAEAAEKLAKVYDKVDKALAKAFGDIDKEYDKIIKKQQEFNQIFETGAASSSMFRDWEDKKAALQDYGAAVQEAYDSTKEETEETATFLEERWKEAWDSVQDAMADFVYDFEFSADALVDIFRRMAAEMTAAALMGGFKSMFADMFGSGDGSGFLGGVSAALGISAASSSSAAGGVAGSVATSIGADALLESLGLSEIGTTISAAIGSVFGQSGGGLFGASLVGAAEEFVPGAVASYTAPTGGGLLTGASAGLLSGLLMGGSFLGMGLLGSLNGSAPSYTEQFTGAEPATLALAGLDEEMKLVSETTLKELVPALTGVEAASLDFASGAVYLKSTMDASTGGIRDQILVYDQLTGAYVEHEYSVADLIQKTLDLVHAEDLSTEAAAALVASQAGIPSMADEIIAAMEAMISAGGSAASGLTGWAGMLAGLQEDILRDQMAGDETGSFYENGSGTEYSAYIDTDNDYMAQREHATGGIFTQPTMWGNHLIGESGPEALVPLSDGPNMLSDMKSMLEALIANAGGSTTPNVQVFIGNEQLDGRIRVVSDQVHTAKTQAGETGRVYY